MISVGGTRPPSPTSVTGRALPVVMTEKVALPIWVIVMSVRRPPRAGARDDAVDVDVVADRRLRAAAPGR